MCGISAIVSLQNRKESNSESADGNASHRDELLHRMQESLDMIKHRGPDSDGTWINGSQDIGPLASVPSMRFSLASTC